MHKALGLIAGTKETKKRNGKSRHPYLLIPDFGEKSFSVLSLSVILTTEFS
jgi:hypothetical protein